MVETSTHLKSASTSHREAAASLLDQSELDAGGPLQRQTTIGLARASCVVPRRGGKHSPLECERQRQACTLSPPPPRTVEQPQACSISRGSMVASVAKANHMHFAWCMVPRA